MANAMEKVGAEVISVVQSDGGDWLIWCRFESDRVMDEAAALFLDDWQAFRRKMKELDAINAEDDRRKSRGKRASRREQ